MRRSTLVIFSLLLGCTSAFAQYEQDRAKPCNAACRAWMRSDGFGTLLSQLGPWETIMDQSSQSFHRTTTRFGRTSIGTLWDAFGICGSLDRAVS
jgi:hypothetical protein